MPPSGAVEMRAEEGEHLAPAVHRLLRTVRRRVVVEEAVPGPVVAVELVGLALLLQLCFQRVDLLGRRALVVVAEQPEHRRLEVLGVLDGRDRLAGREILLVGDDAPAPQVADGREARYAAADQVSVATAGAGANDPDLASAGRQRLE